MSSPAFAYEAPTVVNPPTLSVTKTSARLATLTTAPGTATCSGSANDPTPTVTPTMPIVTQPGVTITVTGGPTTWSLTSSANNWRRGDMITVTMDVTYTCTYTAGSSSICKRVTQVFTSTGNGGSGGFSAGMPVWTDC